MTINYDQYLTREQKETLLTQRVQQFASEAYQHELNKKVATETGDQNAIAIADQAIGILEQAITIHQQELDQLAPTGD